MISALFLICRSILIPRLGTLTVNTAFVTAFAGWFAYVAFLSPRLIHGYPNSVRGLGTARTCYVRTDNLGPALWRFGLVTLCSALLVVVLTLIWKPSAIAQFNSRTFLAKQIMYFGSAWVQALIFFGFILTRLRTIASVFPAKGSRLFVALSTAMIFAVFHSPNPQLMILSLVAGGIWSWIYYEYPNMFALVLSHSILGTLLHQVARMNTRCGPSYLADHTGMETLFPQIASLFASLK